MSNTPVPDSFQRVVRWSIILFLGYAMWHSSGNIMKNITPAPQQQNNVSSKKEDCDKKSAGFPLTSVPLVPVVMPYLRTEDVKTGSGAAAVCGQDAQVTYAFMDMNKKILKTVSKKITLGRGDAPHGVELGVIGMKPGGERLVTMAPSWFVTTDPSVLPPDKSKKDFLIAKLQLAGLSEIPATAFPLNYVDVGTGNGRSSLCGDKTVIGMTLWKTDGSTLFSTDDKPLVFVRGMSQLPYGIEAGIEGMIEGGKRILIIPPAYNKPLIQKQASASLLPIALPEKEIIIAQIHLIHIGDLPPAPVPVSVPLPEQPAKPKESIKSQPDKSL